jgi:hypothetical protein
LPRGSGRTRSLRPKTKAIRTCECTAPVARTRPP